MVRWLKEMNFGMQKFLKQEVYSFEDLNEYCYYVAGTPSGFLTELIRTRSKNIRDENAKILNDNERDFGLFLQKVNIIRDFKPDMLIAVGGGSVIDMAKVINILSYQKSNDYTKIATTNNIIATKA